MNRVAEPEALLAAVCAIALCALAGGTIGLLTCGLAQLSALEPLLLLPLCLLSSCTLLLLEPLPLLPLPLCLLSCTLHTLLAALQLVLHLAELLIAALKRIVFRCQFKLQCTDHARSRALTSACPRLPDRADRLVLVRPPRQSAVAAAAALQ